MSFTANDYILDAAELYADTAYDRVDADVWMRYLNAGIRALILVRPDAGAVTEAVQLVAGVKQTIPTAALRLLDIVGNAGSDGSTPGKIISPSKREHINYSNLLWAASDGETYIENFSYDANTPNTFYVTPPVSAVTDVYVEMSTSQLPTVITAIGDSLGVNDVFFEPLIQFMLYKAFSADTEDVEFQKAQVFFSNFLNLLGIEGKMSQAQGPERKE